MTQEQRREYDRLRYHARRNDLLERLGGHCVDCGRTEDLQFDHVDAKTKSFTLSRSWTKPIEEILIELEKCVLRCGPCHRVKTKEFKDFGVSTLKVVDPKHGTALMYAICKPRCEKCREWRQLYRKKLVSSRGVSVVGDTSSFQVEMAGSRPVLLSSFESDEFKHGASGYELGCKCLVCRAAAAARVKAWREARKN